MADDPDVRVLSNTVQGLLAEVLHKHHGAMLNKYVATVEVIEHSGQRALWVLGSDGLMAWETVGMLAYALDSERDEPADDD